MPGSCWPPPTVSRMLRSLAPSASAKTPHVAGDTATALAASTALRDRPRSGRPPVFTPVEVAEVKALACSKPTDHDLPLSRWSVAELASHATASGLVRPVSASTIGRWLAADAIKPWQHRSWIFPRDRDFATKAARVLDLYERRWDGHASTRTST